MSEVVFLKPQEWGWLGTAALVVTCYVLGYWRGARERREDRELFLRFDTLIRERIAATPRPGNPTPEPPASPNAAS